VVATTAEEAQNPQRDLPRGIIGSLAICTVLYVLVCIVITGMVKYSDINGEAALAEAFRSVGKGGFATLISAGAVAGLTTVVLTLMIGAARVVFAMSRDHLMPKRLGKTHPKWGTPYRLTIGIGIVVALIAGLTPIGKLEEMVNIGTLAAFTLVSIAVPLLRRSRPDIERSFRVPGNPVIPILAAVICVYLMLNLSLETWLRFAIWMVLGFVIYAFYGYKRSRVGLEEKTGEAQKA
jgi:APA family basic amino acid/polyamine antiporter